MGDATPFLVQAPDDRTTPWRVVVDGQRSRGMSLGDAVMPPRTPGPARHVHTRDAGRAPGQPAGTDRRSM